jgi:excisionase family DNA binding protein
MSCGNRRNSTRPCEAGRVRSQWKEDRVPDEPRFLTLADVAEVLNISASQAYALVRNKELPSIKIGGRGQYRVERAKLEDYIARMYAETSAFLDEHPFLDADADRA